MSYVNSIVAAALSLRENHRTDTEYEDALISKLFLFQFVNFYSSFFYIAFVAEYQPAPPDSHEDARFFFVLFYALLQMTGMSVTLDYLR